MEDKIDKLLATTADIALKRRAKFLVLNLGLLSKQKVLDLGCGDGFYLHLLSSLKQSLNLYGMDNDDRALLAAKIRLKNRKVQFKTSDLAEPMPYKNDFFDHVVMSEVAEHIDDDLFAFKQINKILKKNGCLLISVPHQNFPFLWDPINWILSKLFKTHIKSGFWAGFWNQHLRLYTKDELEKKLKKAGFKIVHSEIQTFWCLPFNHYLLNMGARIIAKNPNSFIVRGASKFNSKSKQGLVAQLFIDTSNLIDRLNQFLPVKNTGVSIVVKAVKY